MSYSVHIGKFEANHTSNQSKMWQEFLFDKTEPPTGMFDRGLLCLNGLTGKKAQRILTDFFNRLYDEQLNCAITNREGLSRFDSANGWGCHNSAILFTARILSACTRFPRHKITVLS